VCRRGSGYDERKQSVWLMSWQKLSARGRRKKRQHLELLKKQLRGKQLLCAEGMRKQWHLARSLTRGQMSLK
jgi:hypothetical protein